MENKQQKLIAEINKLEENLLQTDISEIEDETLTEKQAELDKLTQKVDNQQFGSSSNKKLEKLLEQQGEIKSDLEMKKSKIEGTRGRNQTT